MFRFKKKKQQIEIKAPVVGKSVSIESVPDDTFATKLMGEGVAFKFSGSDICAPVTGELILVADTLHAFGIRDTHGVEILVHIGLETVTLNGAGLKKKLCMVCLLAAFLKVSRLLKLTRRIC